VTPRALIERLLKLPLKDFDGCDVSVYLSGQDEVFPIENFVLSDCNGVLDKDSPVICIDA
jgi:hypothetical protein